MNRMTPVVAKGPRTTVPPPMTTLPSEKRSISNQSVGQEPGRCSNSPVILSFDVEEHDRIEAASALTIDPALRAAYRTRLAPSTYWLLDRLAEMKIQATFFIVGEIARDDPGLVRAIHRAGHEVASHSWDHRRVHTHTPASFLEDLRQSKDALEQVTGEAVLGYRAPTFSVVGKTAWAIDVLVESGMLYDSSVYPIRHDRYGVPGAPRSPFFASGGGREILEFPPATLRFLSLCVPVGGGGYFRLLPLSWMERAIAQLNNESPHPAATLYFHPWEFDPDQPRLPLSPLSKFRTYTGIDRTQARLQTLLTQHRFSRAVDVARELVEHQANLPRYRIA